jgi:hypothetical protein
MKGRTNIVARGTAAAALTVALLAAMLTTGCMSRFDSVAVDVPPGGWSDPVEMWYSNSDTLAIRSLTLALRHSSSTDSSSGRYVVVSVSPSGTARRDTLSIDIAFDPAHNRQGEARAERPMRRRLDESGSWLFVVVPMQRTTGVWSVGMEIKNIR